MTLNQRLAELLPHFDDDLMLLPNKVLRYRIGDLAWCTCSGVSLTELVNNMRQGREYRIEDAPKRPRAVWIAPNMSKCVDYEPNRASNYVRFIEDTPREVTDADVAEFWRIYTDRKDNDRAHPDKAVKSALQHYEQSRSK